MNADEIAGTENLDVHMNEFWQRLTVCSDIPLDRFTEICNAERDGRLVVLPCKVGEYWARDGKRYIVAEITMTNAWCVTVRHYEEGDGKMLSCNPRYFAKHYTREAAEAALKGAEHERD